MNDFATFLSTLCLFSPIIVVAFLVILVILAVFLIRQSQAETHRTDQLYTNIARKLDAGRQAIFMTQYSNSKKSGTAAVILALFLGGLGIHKFYLGQLGWGIVYLLFCWTTIPMWVAVIEAFFLPAQVSKYNQKRMREIAATLGLQPTKKTAIPSRLKPQRA